LATVTGPGELSFSWKISCDPLGAFLEVTMDGEQVSKISGEIDWHQKTLILSAGSHTLSWVYRKNWNSNLGADRGWLDQVEFTPTKDLHHRS
jgi:hypothetical protein